MTYSPILKLPAVSLHSSAIRALLVHQHDTVATWS